MGGTPTNDEPDAPTNTPPGAPSVVPWLQAIGIFVFAGLAITDLNVPDAEVPFVVYGGIIAIIWGLGPDVIKSTIKRMGQ